MQSDPAVPGCADVAEDLAAGDDAVLTTVTKAHLAKCLRCQAELAGFRRLQRSMRELAARPVVADHILESEILLALDDVDGRALRRAQSYAAAAVGGLAAATGLLVLATRGRRSPGLAV